MTITSTNDSPVSASITEVPIAFKFSIPSADDPSANAPTETSKPVRAANRKQHCTAAARTPARRDARATRRWQPAYVLEWPCAAQCPPHAPGPSDICEVWQPALSGKGCSHRLAWRARAQEVPFIFSAAQEKDKKKDVKQGVTQKVKRAVAQGAKGCGLFLACWAFSAGTHMFLDAISVLAPDKSPATASGVLQELVETGATLYGVSWCVFSQKQLVDLGTTEHYTQGLDYVDCEAEATFCGLMNVTSYPTWQINGQLYSEYYPLEELSGLLDDLHGRHHHHFRFFQFELVVQLQLVFLLSIWTCSWVYLWFFIISTITNGILFVPNPSGKAKGAPTDVSSRVGCVIIC